MFEDKRAELEEIVLYWNDRLSGKLPRGLLLTGKCVVGVCGCDDVSGDIMRERETWYDDLL